MTPDPVRQIQECAAHITRTYGGVSGSSYVTGAAAVDDAVEIASIIESIVYILIHQCDECGRYYDVTELHRKRSPCCAEKVSVIEAISKRRKK